MHDTQDLLERADDFLAEAKKKSFREKHGKNLAVTTGTTVGALVGLGLLQRATRRRVDRQQAEKIGRTMAGRTTRHVRRTMHQAASRSAARNKARGEQMRRDIEKKYPGVKVRHIEVK
jgi:hypothetical protein